MHDVARDATIANIADEEVASTIDRMAVVSAYLMDKPEVWAAVVGLANKLPAVGRMEGADAVAIITGVLPESDLTGMFAAALEPVRELEQKIGAAEMAVAILPDGSHRIIKGGNLVQRFRTEGKDTVEVLSYKCTFPVYGETLCLAFGDRRLA